MKERKKTSRERTNGFGTCTRVVSSLDRVAQNKPKEKGDVAGLLLRVTSMKKEETQSRLGGAVGRMVR